MQNWANDIDHMYKRQHTNWNFRKEYFFLYACEWDHWAQHHFQHFIDMSEKEGSEICCRNIFGWFANAQYSFVNEILCKSRLIHCLHKYERATEHSHARGNIIKFKNKGTVHVCSNSRLTFKTNIIYCIVVFMYVRVKCIFFWNVRHSVLVVILLFSISITHFCFC